MASTLQTNSLGFVIGGEAEDAMMVLARGEDGKLCGIAEVQRGRACACTCLECGGQLIARKGDILAHHFAHAAGEPCNGSETQAHLFAKKVIETAGSLHLPSLNTYGQINEQAQMFDRIELEKAYSRIRPDLIASVKDRSLFIEIRVTHPVGPAKRAWLTQHKLSCIEIDLRDLRHKPDKDLVPAILRSAPREWLSHRTRVLPFPPLPIGRSSSDSGRVGRILSSAEWYADQTAKDFPDLEQAWREARQRWGFE